MANHTFDYYNKKQKFDLNKTYRSVFMTFDNPENHGFAGDTPLDVLRSLSDVWLDHYPQGTFSGRYCISASGLKHVHAVLESVNPVKGYTFVKILHGANFCRTYGGRKSLLDYLNKRGEFEEKGEKIIESLGDDKDIKGSSISRGVHADIAQASDLIDKGYSWREVLNEYPIFIEKEKYIRQLYFNKRERETPAYYDISVYWHLGDAGSGKSYSTMVALGESVGYKNIYTVRDYDAPFDGYNGEPVLVLDEFRGSFKYQTLLEVCDRYKCILHARYANIVKLWNEVHITSVMTPEECYKNMVAENDRGSDAIDQLLRRLTAFVYHKKFGDGYKSVVIPVSLWVSRSHADDCIRVFNGLSPICHRVDELRTVLNYNAELSQKEKERQTLDSCTSSNE